MPTTTDPPNRPPLILIVGMHRSGTSLLGSMLKQLGVSLPGELLDGDIYNPEGYWERRDISNLQEQLLIDLGRWWPSAAGVFPLPENWLEWPCTRRIAGQLRQLLTLEADRQCGPWAIKDPRSSLLLPLWRQLCQELSIPLRLVHAVRNPAEVMISLLRRDKITAGMTAMRAQQLWWHHNIRILEDGVDLPRLIVHYTRWFECQQGQHQLVQLSQFCHNTLPSREIQAAALIEVKPQHRRSQNVQSLPIPIHRGLRNLNDALMHSSIHPTKACRVSIPPTPRWRNQDPLLPPRPLPQSCRIEVIGYGATTCHWSIHAWLQRCWLPPGFKLSEDNSAEPIGMHLQPVELSQRSGALKQLRQLPMVLDPKLKRVEQLRLLGVKAYWIDPSTTSNGWLEKNFDATTASQQFGLPNPDMLHTHGQILCMGTSGDSWERSLPPTIWALPFFDSLHVPNVDAARLLAGWLNACNRSGLQLVKFNPSDYEREGLPFEALDHTCQGPDDWLPPILLEGPLDTKGLESELAWRRKGQPRPLPCHTPTPNAQLLWESGKAGAQAAVCISLYNYADRVLAALDSVRLQTHRPLELIVVDDNSNDGSDQRVAAWLQDNSQVFERAVLIRHVENGGLAAARNTAFATTKAAWCFVLDADNTLQPEAVARCLAVAEHSPTTTAVVHPLVELQSESWVAGQPQQALLTRIPWQRQALLHGNQIDAMALIRREHWERVGGYTHIPGGWEDYDFWCKVIEAGLHGVICPQRLAVYNRHSSSMQATDTLSNLLSLKRILMDRHPWLELDARAMP
jgi:GT2 family glycosyltransferase